MRTDRPRGDYLSSSWHRRQNWFGLKKYVKAGLGFRPLNVPLARGLRRVLSPTRARRLPVSVAEVEANVGFHTVVMLCPAKCSIAKELFWGNGHRVDAQERFALELFAELARSSATVLDIGSNTGLFSLVAAVSNLSADVHAFEIVPDVYILLVRNVVRNGLANRIACHLRGVGQDGFEMTLPPNSEGSSLPSAYSSRLVFDSGVRVRFDSLDGLVPIFRQHGPTLIKIDVEGTEDDIFKGAERFTREREPDFLCEILPGESSQTTVSDFLDRHGYAAYKIRETALEASDSVKADERYHDWFFTKRRDSEVAEIVGRVCARISGR